MKTFNCILGIFSILGALYCICYPGLTFLNSGWIVAMLLGVYGVCSIFEFFSNSKGMKKKGMLTDGILGLILGIGAAVVSVIAMFDVRTRAWIDLIILLAFAVWMIYSGSSSIVKAFAAKKAGSKMWVLSLILGILVILTGLYCSVHPLINAFAIGYVIGTGLMIYGIRLIASVGEAAD